jgi:hypothetical protein
MNTNFSGTWKANFPKSRLLTPPPLAIEVKIVQSENAIQEELIATKSDGACDRIVFKCKLDENPSIAFLNEMPLRGLTRWQGDELIIESWIQRGDRELHFCDCWSLSADAQTLIMEHRNDVLAGQLTVFERMK